MRAAVVKTLLALAVYATVSALASPFESLTEPLLGNCDASAKVIVVAVAAAPAGRVLDG